MHGYPEMEYTQRLHQFTSTRTWKLTDDSICWSEESGSSGEVHYSVITKVRLRYEPTRFETNRYSLIFQAPIEYKITNIHYQGVMDFKDQSEDYRSFVKALHANLVSHDSKASFASGSTATAYLMNILLTVLKISIWH